MSIKISPALALLRADFVASGCDIHFVGGCVRDHLLGINPKDVDLCTDASPDEQIAIYKALDVNFYPIGIDHGTITINIGNDEWYEITSLRTESEHDGRHAKCVFTKDWVEDLSRRDLTINAMSMDFEGNVFDPFGGADDLKTLTMRFVGNPEERMTEDYLRILRLARFCARFSRSIPFGLHMPIYRCSKGLKTISRERVWSEISKTLTYRFGVNALKGLADSDVLVNIDLPPHLNWRLASEIRTDDPVVKMAALLMDSDIDIGKAWRWSKAEMVKFQFVKENAFTAKSMKEFLVLDGTPKPLVKALCAFKGMAWIYEDYKIPECPVKGEDVLALGFKGKEVGDVLTKIRHFWFFHGCGWDKEALLLDWTNGLIAKHHFVKGA